ncbi:MAG: hypothetical protein Q7J72_07390 [Candidatus Omnitrophota bacterium]|nr:hypothetical protein [Candidatus Omnitrophota bacterium]
MAPRAQGYEKLFPPFVPELRKRVKEWRDKGYEGASATSRALLSWRFKEDLLLMEYKLTVRERRDNVYCPGLTPKT